MANRKAPGEDASVSIDYQQLPYKTSYTEMTSSKFRVSDEVVANRVAEAWSAGGILPTI